MALDYGDKTVGVAISDALGFTAQPIETIHRDDEVSIKKTVARIKELVLNYHIGAIVLGYPKSLNNTEGERCIKTIAFKERLQRNIKGIEIILWDERLSTKGALRGLESLSRKDQDKVIDKMAATFILQGFMQANPAMFNKED
jgi:putative Holliday junction resolvase